MRRIGRRGLQLREDVLQVARRMLGVEQDPVEPRPGDHLHRVVRRQARPQADLRSSGAQRALERVLGQVHVRWRVYGRSGVYSNFAPDSFTTLAHLACSVRSQLPRLSGVSVRTSVPCLAKRSFISAALRTFTNSEFNLVTVSRGIPTGPTTPW